MDDFRLAVVYTFHIPPLKVYAQVERLRTNTVPFHLFTFAKRTPNAAATNNDDAVCTEQKAACGANKSIQLLYCARVPHGNAAKIKKGFTFRLILNYLGAPQYPQSMGFPLVLRERSMRSSSIKSGIGTDRRHETHKKIERGGKTF